MKRALALLPLLLAAGCFAPSRPGFEERFNFWPLARYESRPPAAGPPGHALDVLWPLGVHERDGEYAQTRLLPFMSRTREREGEFEDTYLLLGGQSVDVARDEHAWWLLPLAFARRTPATDVTYLTPLWFQRVRRAPPADAAPAEAADGAEADEAGSVEGEAPDPPGSFTWAGLLYLHEETPEREATRLLPFFHFVRGEREQATHFWPLFGSTREEDEEGNPTRGITGLAGLIGARWSDATSRWHALGLPPLFALARGERDDGEGRSEFAALEILDDVFQAFAAKRESPSRSSFRVLGNPNLVALAHGERDDEAGSRSFGVLEVLDGLFTGFGHVRESETRSSFRLLGGPDLLAVAHGERDDEAGSRSLAVLDVLGGLFTGFGHARESATRSSFRLLGDPRLVALAHAEQDDESGSRKAAVLDVLNGTFQAFGTERDAEGASSYRVLGHPDLLVLAHGEDDGAEDGRRSFRAGAVLGSLFRLFEHESDAGESHGAVVEALDALALASWRSSPQDAYAARFLTLSRDQRALALAELSRGPAWNDGEAERHAHLHPLFEWTRGDCFGADSVGLVLYRGEHDEGSGRTTRSIAWPFVGWERVERGDHAGGHFRVLPLLWLDWRPETRTTVVVPFWVHLEDEAFDRRYVPLLWGDHEARDGSYRRRFVLPPLWVRTERTPAGGDHVRRDDVLFPLAAHEVRPGGGTTRIFPLFYADRDGGRSTLNVLGLFHRRRDGEFGRTDLFPLAAFEDRADGHLRYVAPLFFFAREGDASTQNVLGLFHRREDATRERVDLFPLAAHERRETGWTRYLLPFFYADREGEASTLNVLALFHQERAPGFERTSLLPLAGRERRVGGGSDYVFPLFYADRQDEASTLNVLGLFHRQVNDEHVRTDLFPLVRNEVQANGHTRYALPLFYDRREGDERSSVILGAYHRRASADAAAWQLWPLVARARAEGEGADGSRLSLLPLLDPRHFLARRPAGRETALLWPLFFANETAESARAGFLYPLAGATRTPALRSHWLLWAWHSETGVADGTYRRSAFWPLFQAKRDADGTSSWHVLYLLANRLAEADGATEFRLLHALFRSRTAPDVATWSVPFLARYRRDDAGARLYLFHLIPVPMPAGA